jgi:hypothetical protein
MENLTLPNFQQWARDNKPLALAVSGARVFAEMEKERVNAYILPIFAKYEFYNDLECEQTNSRRAERTRITNPALLYLSTDEEQVQRYYEETYDAHEQHGWTGERGYCPALVARHLQVQAENTLLESYQSQMDIETMCLTLEKRQRMLDLLLGACLAK